MNGSGASARRIAVAVPLAFAVSLVLFGALPSFALDLSASVGAADHSELRYRNEAGLRQTDEIVIGQSIAGWLYVKAALSHADLIDVSAPAPFFPAESLGVFTIEWVSDAALAGLTAEIRGTGAGTGVFPGAFGKLYLPIVGDIVELDAGVRFSTDFTGLYGEIDLAPTAYLPLSKPVLVDLKLALGYLAGSYDGVTLTGFSTLTVQPELSVNAARFLSVGISGGYNLDLSGGRLASYPYVQGAIRISADGIGD